jgi:1,4-dihydroxy-2-naphthoyl-CoA hydrolase
MSKSIWSHPFELSDLCLRAKNSFSDFLGIEFIEIGPDFLTARMPIAPQILQPMGIMHGGASAALAETVASVAANYCVDQSTQVCVGLELNINHLRSLKNGYADAVAKPLHLGKTTQVWEIKIYNQEKQLVSASRLTLAVTQKK